MKKCSLWLAAGIIAASIGSAIAADDNKVVYFYNWSEYVPPGLLNQFTKETGIKVIYSTYESNESMYTKLKTYTEGAYDLVVPSTYFVAKMSKEGMLQKIDKSKLNQFKNLIQIYYINPLILKMIIQYLIFGERQVLVSIVRLLILKPLPLGQIYGDLNIKMGCY